MLKLFQFCEGYDKYTRQHIARVIYQHEQSKRMAESAGMPHREFVSLMSKEFCSRCLSAGYLDGVGGVFWCKGKLKRPAMMNLNCMDGYKTRHCYEMMHIGEMGDDELFGERRNVDRSERRVVRKNAAN